MPKEVDISNILIQTKEQLYNPCNFYISNLNIEKESQDYGACRFVLNGKKIIFREAKITPTKTGQFVTLWKRNLENKIQPFAENDDFDFVVISTKSNANLGQFVFPKSVLKDQKILSYSNNKGKLAIRVYPSWDQVVSKQAIKTQLWQLHYFLRLSEKEMVTIELAKKLYEL